MEVRHIVRVFLASPGGLEEERAVAVKVVGNLNRRLGPFLKVQIDLVRWEATPRGYGRAQGHINKELARCELFVGMLWKEWGSPTGEYSSGFEEEFRISEQSLQKTGKPEIKILFKAVDRDDPGDKLKKILAFQEEIRPRIFYDEFVDLHQFEEKLEDCITSFLLELAKESGPDAVPSERAEEDSNSSAAAPIGQRRLDRKTLDFVTSFASSLAAASHDVELDPVQCARLRLVSSSISAAGNDEITLGVHDSNLLFARRAAVALSKQEASRLVDTALAHYEHENVPLWHWIAELGGLEQAQLFLRAIIGPTARRVGALKALRYLKSPFDGEDFVPRAVWTERTIGAEAPEEVRVAALEYLAECGIEADMPLVTGESLRTNYKTSAAATSAAIRIRLRESRQKAAETLASIEPDAVDPGLLSQVFEKPDTITDDALKACLLVRAPNVRAYAARLLARRRKLTQAVAEGLLGDEDPSVRLEALWALHSSSRTYSDDEAKRVLVRKRPKRNYLSFASGTETEGGPELEEFRSRALALLSKSQLDELAEGETILDRAGWLYRARRDFARRGRALREAIDDEFSREYDDAIAAKGDGVPRESLDRLRSIKQTVQAELVRRALAIICVVGGDEDLARVRRVVGRDDLVLTPVELDYFRRFGEWSDVDLILLKLSAMRSGSLLLGSHVPKLTADAAARTLSALARGRVTELLEKEVPDRVAAGVVALWKESEIAQLSDSQLLKLLRTAKDSLRKLTAIKCALALPKIRSRSLLAEYMSPAETYYYNVAHWLDCALALPRRDAKAVARFALGIESDMVG